MVLKMITKKFGFPKIAMLVVGLAGLFIALEASNVIGVMMGSFCS